MTVEALLAEVKTTVEALNKAHADQGKQVAEILAANQNNEKVSKDAIAKADKLAADITALTDRLVESEQKMAAGVQEGKIAPKTLGQIIIATDAFKDFASGASNKARIDVQANTITGQDGGSPPRNSDTLVAADRLAGIVPGAFRRLRIRDILPQGVTSSNAIEFTRELAFTNAAAETAEGDTKPQATLTFELVNAPVRTIAHWIKATKQALDDAQALASYIDARLRHGVNNRIDSQILNGNGVSQNLSGLLTPQNYTSFSPTVGETELDSLNRMKYLVDTSDYMATGIVLNPATWGGIERIKGDDDHYVVGSPLAPYGPTLWGLPVVVSNQMVAGKALVAGFDVLAQVFERSGTVVEMFEQDETNVQKNLVTIRAEARLALAVYTPAASRYGALTAPGASA